MRVALIVCTLIGMMPLAVHAQNTTTTRLKSSLEQARLAAAGQTTPAPAPATTTPKPAKADEMAPVSTKPPVPVPQPPINTPQVTRETTTTSSGVINDKREEVDLAPSNDIVMPPVPSPRVAANMPERITAPLPPPTRARFMPPPPPIYNENEDSAPPAHLVSAWQTRVIGDKNTSATDRFCLLEAPFDNDASLLIGQRADGYSTLGVNYGLDMLQKGQSYNANIQVGYGFAEDFSGAAENTRLIIAQLGRKYSFFDAVTNADTIRIALPGVVSNFATDGLTEALTDFAACLQKLGGALTITDAPKPVLAQDMAMVETITQAPLPAPAPAPAPAPVPVAAPTPQPIPVKPLPVVTPPAPLAVAPPLDLTPKPAPAPVPVPAPKPVMPPPVAKPIEQTWDKKLVAYLSAAKIAPQQMTKNKDSITWADKAAMLKFTARPVATGDALDAGNAALDNAKQLCVGAFDAQLGLPETRGNIDLQPMESKCTNSKGGAAITAWLVTHQDNKNIIVQIDADRYNRTAAFKMRDMLLRSIPVGQ